MKELNEELIDILQKWDPLGYGIESYETEVVDVIQAVHEIDDFKFLAKRIQFIYEFSFEETIPLRKCQDIARTLMSLKEGSSCIN